MGAISSPESSEHVPATSRSRWYIAASVVTVVLIYMCTFDTERLPSNPFEHASYELAPAKAMLHAVQTNFIQLAEPGMTGMDVLDKLDDYNGMIVFATGTKQPERREVERPFFSVDSASTLPQHVVDAINRGAGVAEAAVGRLLFPILLRTQKLQRASKWFSSTTQGPFAVFDFSTGALVVDTSLVSSWQSERVLYFMKAMGSNIFMGLEKAGNLGAAASGGAAVVPLLLMSSTLALYAAFAAAPPLWFCLACPTVLGLLAPLVINFGLGDLATLVCQRMQLTDEACYDLLLGALGLGFVLSLASAVPIFLVCRLAECAHRNGSAVLSVLPRRWKLF